MLWLLDSNALLRLFHRSDAQHALVRQAMATLWARGDRFAYTSQILGEFWSVCTRPSTARGGLSVSLAETDRRLRVIERFYRFLPDTQAVHAEWRRIIVTHAVMGAQVHDARLVAAMSVHGVTHLLTLNISDFARYPGITAQHPQDI
jgi:predicted nucleic acid-binding protein